VHVLVADVNDNRPVFTHPPLADNHSAVVELTDTHSAGVELADVHSAVVELADNHSAVVELVDNHSALVEQTDNHSAVVELVDNHSAVVELADTHSAVVELADNHSAVVELADNHSAVVELVDNHSAGVELTDTHSAVVELESSAPVGHLVTLVTAVDDDVGVNARLSYSIVDEQSEWLSVDAESGEVRVAAPLPRDSVTYDLLIAASDAGMPVRLSSHATLHVVVRPSAAVASSRRRSAGSGVPADGRDMSWWLVAGACLAASLVSLILA